MFVEPLLMFVSPSKQWRKKTLSCGSYVYTVSSDQDEGTTTAGSGYGSFNGPAGNIYQYLSLLPSKCGRVWRL